MDPPCVFDVSCGHSHIDGESSGSQLSLNEELGIPSVVTPSVRKIRNVIKAPGGDAGTRSPHVLSILLIG